jgi:pimeloyl-ACP methyl ester carboxylesterase
LATLFTNSVSAGVVEEAAAIMRDFHPAGMRAMARAFAEADLRDVLPNIDVPTLLLYGDADQRSPRDVAEALHAAIPGSRLVWIHGVGHQSNLEAPGRFNEAARAFLRSV